MPWGGARQGEQSGGRGRVGHTKALLTLLGVGGVQASCSGGVSTALVLQLAKQQHEACAPPGVLVGHRRRLQAAHRP